MVSECSWAVETFVPFDDVVGLQYLRGMHLNDSDSDSSGKENAVADDVPVISEYNCCFRPVCVFR